MNKTKDIAVFFWTIVLASALALAMAYFVYVPTLAVSAQPAADAVKVENRITQWETTTEGGSNVICFQAWDANQAMTGFSCVVAR